MYYIGVIWGIMEKQNGNYRDYRVYIPKIGGVPFMEMFRALA